MRRILLLLRRLYWATVLVATLLPAVLAGIFEYFMSGGTSGWVPLWAGVASGILTTCVLLLILALESKPTDRVFTNRSANELVEQINGLTDMAAKPIVDRHIGTWMRVRNVPVFDIVESDGIVLVDDVPSYSRPGFSMSFNKKEWIDKLSILDREDQISAIGRISDIAGDMIWLEQCEIEDDDATP